jgi:hypothetical protein
MIHLADTLRTSRLQLLADAMSGGTLTLYTAPMPSIGGAITTQTALVNVDIPTGLTAEDGSFPITLLPTEVIATGESLWGRIVSADDDFVLDGDCGLLESTALFKLKTTYLQAGASLIPIVVSFAEP